MTSYLRWRAHPWHGLDPGPDPPGLVHAYIEITPFDVVKYEVDKATGYLKVDRPQQTSSSPPTLYGFVPRTYAGERVRRLCPGATAGDGDPIDICVISERPIERADILLTARVVGGFQMLDGGEADDKIIAILARDPAWNEVQELDELPAPLIDRLSHYFETYKLFPGSDAVTSIQETYGAARAREVIAAAMADYADRFSAPPER